jgi:hypothetical protein
MLLTSAIDSCSQVAQSGLQTKFNPFKTKRVCFVSGPSPYRAVNTVSVIKASQLMLYREIIAVCSEIHTKHINSLCGQNVEFVNVKPGGTYGNHWALKEDPARTAQ